MEGAKLLTYKLKKKNARERGRAVENITKRVRDFIPL